MQKSKEEMAEEAFDKFCCKAGVWESQHDYVKATHKDGYLAGYSAAQDEILLLRAKLEKAKNEVYVCYGISSEGDILERIADTNKRYDAFVRELNALTLETMESK